MAFQVLQDLLNLLWGFPGQCPGVLGPKQGQQFFFRFHLADIDLPDMAVLLVVPGGEDHTVGSAAESFQVWVVRHIEIIYHNEHFPVRDLL